jgi:hypothetical protein
MIEHRIDTGNAILHILLNSSLEKTDFEDPARSVDAYLVTKGDRAGLIIETPAFPGRDPDESGAEDESKEVKADASTA